MNVKDTLVLKYDLSYIFLSTNPMADTEFAMDWLSKIEPQKKESKPSILHPKFSWRVETENCEYHLHASWEEPSMFVSFVTDKAEQNKWMNDPLQREI